MSGPRSRFAANATTFAALALLGGSLAVPSLARWALPEVVVSDLLLRGLGSWMRGTAFLAAIALAAAAWRAREALYRERDWLAAAFVLAVAGPTLAWYVAPHGHKLYFDEDIYLQIGMSLAAEDRAGILDLALPDSTRPTGWRGVHWTLNKEPIGGPFLFSLAAPVLGYDDALSGKVNLILFGLSIFGLAIVARWAPWWAGRPWATLTAPALFAVWPENLRWAVSGAVEPAAVATAVWAMALAARAGRTGAAIDRLAACGFVALAVVVRPEGWLLLVPFAVLFAGSAWRDAWREMPRERLGVLVINFRRALPWLALVAVALAPHAANLALAADEDWGADGPKFTLDVLPENLVHNLGYWFLQTPAGRTTPEAPAGWAVLATIGLTVAAWSAIGTASSRRAALGRTWLAGIALWGGLFFGVFLPFYAGSYHHGVDVRFSLLVVPVYTLLVAAGFDAIDRLVRRRGVLLRAASAAVFVFLPLLGPLVRVPEVTEEAWQARADHAAVEVMSGRMEPDAVVVTHTPSQWAVRGVAAAQVGRLDAAPRLVADLAARGPLYYSVNYWDVMPSEDKTAAFEAAAVARRVRERHDWEDAGVVEAPGGLTFRMLRWRVSRTADAEGEVGAR